MNILFYSAYSRTSIELRCDTWPFKIITTRPRFLGTNCVCRKVKKIDVNMHIGDGGKNVASALQQQMNVVIVSLFCLEVIAAEVVLGISGLSKRLYSSEVFMSRSKYTSTYPMCIPRTRASETPFDFLTDKLGFGRKYDLSQFSPANLLLLCITVFVFANFEYEE